MPLGARRVPPPPKASDDYEEIKWEHKVYVNGVASDTLARSYHTTTMSTTVTIA